MIAAIEWESAPVSRARRAELDAHAPVTVTEVSPVIAITVGFLIRDQSRGLDDHRKLSQMLGLEEPVKPPRSRKTPEPVAGDFFRRGHGRPRR
jgi:hypothetical protein